MMVVVTGSPNGVTVLCVIGDVWPLVLSAGWVSVGVTAGSRLGPWPFNQPGRRHAQTAYTSVRQRAREAG
jgi:hypothetical protein